MRNILTSFAFVIMMIMAFSCTDNAKTGSSNENGPTASQAGDDILDGDTAGTKSETEAADNKTNATEEQAKPASPMAADGSSQTSLPQKRALVIGLGKQKDTHWGKINGDKDVPLINNMLSKAGYKDIKKLVNEEATKSNIVKAFRELTARCNAGDIVYIHFSGHGQLMTDRDGDEKDSFDESWIPYDAYFSPNENDDGSKHLSDDEVNLYLAQVKKKVGAQGKILVVVDACHSGGSDHGINDEVIRGAGIYDVFSTPKKEAKPRQQYEREWVFLSACGPHQSNAEIEINRNYYGKLTYALYAMDMSKPLNNDEFKTYIINFMDKNQKEIHQTPQLMNKANYNIWDFFK